MSVEEITEMEAMRRMMDSGVPETVALMLVRTDEISRQYWLAKIETKKGRSEIANRVIGRVVDLLNKYKHVCREASWSNSHARENPDWLDGPKLIAIANRAGVHSALQELKHDLGLRDKTLSNYSLSDWITDIFDEIKQWRDQ